MTMSNQEPFQSFARFFMCTLIIIICFGAISIQVDFVLLLLYSVFFLLSLSLTVSVLMGLYTLQLQHRHAEKWQKSAIELYYLGLSPLEILIFSLSPGSLLHY